MMKFEEQLASVEFVEDLIGSMGYSSHRLVVNAKNGELDYALDNLDDDEVVVLSLNDCTIAENLGYDDEVAVSDLYDGADEAGKEKMRERVVDYVIGDIDYALDTYSDYIDENVG